MSENDPVERAHLKFRTVAGSLPVHRYDPDNFQDNACGDEISSLAPDVTPLAEPGAGEESGYRTIGQFPVLPVASPQMVYLHLDHLGSVRVMTGDNGSKIAGYHFMPFGDEMPSTTAATTNTRKFTGHERDTATGLDYMLARYYSSSLGRFASVDPLMSSADPSLPQSWNRYSYAWNNPVLLFDPTGEIVELTGKTAAEREEELNLIRHSLHDNALASQLVIQEVANEDGSVSYQVVIQGDAQAFSESSPTAALVGEAIGSQNTIEFGFGSITKTTATEGGNSRITINPNDALTVVNGVIQTFDTMTQHEFGHALGISKGMHLSPDRELGRVRIDRIGTIPEALAAENAARAWYVQRAKQRYGEGSQAARSANILYGKPRDTHF